MRDIRDVVNIKYYTSILISTGATTVFKATIEGKETVSYGRDIIIVILLKFSITVISI